jgi:hypothetical protein
MPISTYLKKKNCLTLLYNFSIFWAPKTHFRAERHENKEKHLFYFGLGILLPIQIQFLDIQNPKNPKIDSPSTVLISTPACPHLPVFGFAACLHLLILGLSQLSLAQLPLTI